jgi:hypothetical protein
MHCLSPKINASVQWKNLENPEPIQVFMIYIYDLLKKMTFKSFYSSNTAL